MLVTSCDAPLRVLATMQGDSAKERELHTCFAGIRKYGEWFHPRQELLEFIDEIGPFDPKTMKPKNNMIYLSKDALADLDDYRKQVEKETGIACDRSQAVLKLLKENA